MFPKKETLDLINSHVQKNEIVFSTQKKDVVVDLKMEDTDLRKIIETEYGSPSKDSEEEETRLNAILTAVVKITVDHVTKLKKGSNA